MSGDGAGLLSVPGYLINLDSRRAWVTLLAVGAGSRSLCFVLRFFLSRLTFLFFVPLSWRRFDIDGNTVTKGR